MWCGLDMHRASLPGRVSLRGVVDERTVLAQQYVLEMPISRGEEEVEERGAHLRGSSGLGCAAVSRRQGAVPWR